MAYEKQLRELGLLSLEVQPRGDLTAILRHLKGASREDRGRLFSEMCSRRMRGNRHITVTGIPTGHMKGIFHHQGSQTQKSTVHRGWEVSGLGSYCRVLALKISHLTPFH